MASGKNNLKTGPASNPAIFFLHGCPRSGTTYLSRLLSSHPEISYIEEARLGPYIERNIEEVYEILCLQEKMRRAGPLAGVSRHGVKYQVALSHEVEAALKKQSRIEVGRTVRPFLTGFLEKSGKQVLIEKTPDNTFYLETLTYVFPEAFFINVFRDGRDVASSYIERDLFKLWNIDLEGLRPEEWVAHRWIQHLEKADAYSRVSGERSSDLRYEDMTADLRGAVRPLLKKMGLEWEREMEHFLEHGMEGWVPDRKGVYASVLSAGQVRRFESIAGEWLERLGYLRERGTRNAFPWSKS